MQDIIRSTTSISDFIKTSKNFLYSEDDGFFAKRLINLIGGMYDFHEYAFIVMSKFDPLQELDFDEIAIKRFMLSIDNRKYVSTNIVRYYSDLKRSKKCFKSSSIAQLLVKHPSFKHSKLSCEQISVLLLEMRKDLSPSNCGDYDNFLRSLVFFSLIELCRDYVMYVISNSEYSN